MSEKILAIDLGHRTSKCGAEAVPGATVWRKRIPTTPAAVHDVIAESDPDVVVVEACSQAFWVHDVASAMGKECVVTAMNGPEFKWAAQRSKSDDADVDRLLSMRRMGRLQPVLVPAHDVREWRTAIRHRHALVRRQTRVRNRVRAVYRERAMALPEASSWTRAFLDELAKDARAFAKCGGELWRGVLHQELAQLTQLHKLILESERTLNRIGKAHPAVAELRRDGETGPRTAEALVAAIVDPLRFTRGKRVGCFAGLTPRRWQSGETDRQGRISGAGDGLLRAMLVEVSWRAIRRSDSWERRVFDQVSKGMKSRRKVAIVAVARKKLVRLWARWRDRELAQRAAAPS